MTTEVNGNGALPLPNGWFAVAWSKDLVPGEVKRCKYFGQELALFRTRSGEAKVIDAYCAHLGAHLAEGGRVVGEALQCPFHGWMYDGNGQCVGIPYCDQVPKTARVRGWPVVELNHMIFAWYHAEGKAPDWEIPEMPEFDDPEWTEPRAHELHVPAHMQDMAENNCDPVHFQYVHGHREPWATDIDIAEDGRFLRAVSTYPADERFGDLQPLLERDTYGLGLTAVRLKGIPGGSMVMLSSTTAVDSENTHSRWLFTATQNMADIGGEEFIIGLTTGVQEDMRIWSNKIHRARPVFCKADEPLALFRKWAKQFYS